MSAVVGASLGSDSEENSGHSENSGNNSVIFPLEMRDNEEEDIHRRFNIDKEKSKDRFGDSEEIHSNQMSSQKPGVKTPFSHFSNKSSNRDLEYALSEQKKRAAISRNQESANISPEKPVNSIGKEHLSRI